ncbi:MAG TPA: hypothetical protein VMI92_06550 [Steroidobacteraceae bacterium]|nr:hypothetical protein [Steroidobacteraceae bacterium]
MSAWQIYAAGEHQHAVDDPLPPLKALLEASTGRAVRRVGRFIQLALIGAARCRPPDIGIPTETAVYLASGRGDLELTLEIMTQLFKGGHSPKPLNFVNTVSNAACFYVAQLLQLQSRSNFVGSRHFAFESVLQLAVQDLEAAVVDSALVGSVDIASAPLDEHRRRLGVPPGTRMGEASHWLWMGAPHRARPRLGDLLAARHFADRSALLQWIGQQQLGSGKCLLACGQFLDAADFDLLRTESGVAGVFVYRSQLPYYDSQSAAVIGEFLRAPDAGQLLHLNADHNGRYSALLVRRRS